MELKASDTETVATGAAVTVIVVDPVLPSLVAMIWAVPSACAVTTPVFDTVATAVLSEAHVTDRPVRAPPFESNVAAVAWVVPTAVIDVCASETVTDATGTRVTVIHEVPLTPSLVAVIVAVPAMCAVTSPFPSTVATEVLFETQVTLLPDRALF